MNNPEALANEEFHKKSALDEKMKQVKSASEAGDMETAEKLSAEFIDMYRELRFIDPSIELTVEDMDLEILARKLNKMNAKEAESIVHEISEKENRKLHGKKLH